MATVDPTTYPPAAGNADEPEPEPEADAVAAVEHALREVEAQLGGLDALIAVRKAELDSLVALRKRAARALEDNPSKPGPKRPGRAPRNTTRHPRQGSWPRCSNGCGPTARVTTISGWPR